MPRMLERESCPDCGVRVATYTVVDLDGTPTGETVVVDRVPSLHGYFRRTSLPRGEVVETDTRAAGLFRPHHETCQSTRPESGR